MFPPSLRVGHKSRFLKNARRRTFAFEWTTSDGIARDSFPAETSSEVTTKMMESSFGCRVCVRLMVWHGESLDGANLERMKPGLKVVEP